MIISSPTGVYKTQLPTSDSDAGNVIYTVSTRVKRIASSIPVIPNAVRRRELPNKIIKKRYGNLVITDVKSNVTASADNTIYNIGQILEFADSQSIPVSYNASSITKQNYQSNNINHSEIGINNTALDTINIKARAKYDSLIIELRVLQQSILDKQFKIQENQKKIADTNKVLEAIKLINDDSLLDTIETLESNLIIYQSNIDRINLELTDDNNKIIVINNNINLLGDLIK